MLWLYDEEVVTLGGANKFESRPDGAGESSKIQQFFVLSKIEIVWESCLVLIVDDTRTGAIVLRQLLREYKLVALWGTIGRRNDQTIVRVNKDNVTAP